MKREIKRRKIKILNNTYNFHPFGGLTGINNESNFTNEFKLIIN